MPLLVAIVSLVVGAATGPTNAVNQMAAIPAITSLSKQQREQLPASTKVSVGKYVVTLGALRNEHLQRATNISMAAGLGTSALKLLNAGPVYKEVGNLHLSASNLIALLQQTPVVEPPGTYSQTALDMQKFCNAAQATVCLYYPPSTTLFQGGGWAENIDPYITDKSVCNSQGGMLLQSGCQYNYNTWYEAQFNPGSGFASKVDCNSTYWTVTAIDKHGAVVVNSVIPLGTTFTTGGVAAHCLVRVWVQP
ncbi:MAG: hypothetical protein JO219_02140 [Candidatus Eremiobacteraeota bacterium]|nr:hypothetical protein [Candidatus Eremiobacteraeota bacterium]MBV8367030.1 hypothetical protein [Candidatus Eremiobacteraeota bacterium]